jgi:hypothetical protein
MERIRTTTGNSAAMNISGKTATYNYIISANEKPGTWRFECRVSDDRNSATGGFWDFPLSLPTARPWQTPAGHIAVLRDRLLLLKASDHRILTATPSPIHGILAMASLEPVTIPAIPMQLPVPRLLLYL